MIEGRIFTLLRVACAFAAAVVLHIACGPLLPVLGMDSWTGMLLFGSFLAWLPFVGAGVWVNARQPDTELVVLRWAFAGVAAVPFVWMVDVAIIAVLLLMGYGRFHI